MLEDKLAAEIGRLVIAVHQRDAQIEMLQEQIKTLSKATQQPVEVPSDGS